MGDSINLEEYTASVICYISKSIDDITVSKAINSHPNQKLLMTTKVCKLLQIHDSAFRSDDKMTARANLTRVIKEAKRVYTQRIHSHFRDSGDTQSMWKGIQAITNHRTALPACAGNASLSDELNNFYAQFEHKMM
ncbi:hypothetical protein chiPu_0001040 [Chiloscyllium punctatum]|uniref:Uncharacterized protein n=1 Tax=Chiloscyllium punctatum TaxID=137246 RepID=A0A401RWZ3_CHIPU|nr:hypothetical protein [Chiloscyllium punctatum]